LRHRSEPLLARRAARHNYYPSASRDGRWFVNEGGKVVSVEFGAECGVQTDFFMVSPWTGAETGRQNSTSPLVANSAPVSIPTSTNPNSDEVFAGPDGAIYVLWDAGGPKFSSSQDSGATFFKNSTAIGIAISGGPPSLVADACGNVTVVGESGTIDTF
jgi:hypothetical protein